MTSRDCLAVRGGIWAELVLCCFFCSCMKIQLQPPSDINQTSTTTGTATTGSSGTTGNAAACPSETFPAGLTQVNLTPSFYGASPAAISLNGELLYTGNTASSGAQLWATNLGGCTVQLTTGNGTIGINPQFLTQVAGWIYFEANDFKATRAQLWRTDGSLPGTTRITDSYVSSGGIFPSHLSNVSGTLFFIGMDPVAGEQVFKSDGTAAGTVEVPGQGAVGIDGNSVETAVAGSHFYYTSNNHSLVSTEGSDIAVLVEGNPPYSTGASNLLGVGDKLFYTAYDNDTMMQLFVTDGTLPGTQKLTSFPKNGTSPTYFASYGNGIYFVGDASPGATNPQIYKSDGTVAGTVEITNIVGLKPSELMEIGGKLYFSGSDSANGSQIWLWDGTTTTRLTSLNGSTGLYPTLLANISLELFFSGLAGSSGYQLYALEGSAVQKLTSSPYGSSSLPQFIGSYSNAFLFSQGSQYWMWATSSSFP